MSVCILVKVGEGLVLASDSASTVSGAPRTAEGTVGPQGVVKIFYNATKMFQIGDLPVGVLSWGAGSFQARTIASLVEEFENTDEVKAISKENVNISDIAHAIRKFMVQKSDELFPDIPNKGRAKIGLIICGYSLKDFFPEEYVMIVPVEEPRRIRPPIDSKPDFGANWYGATDAIVRFHHGRDDRLSHILGQEGIEPDKIKKIEDNIRTNVQYTILFQAMSLKDAIDYAKFLVELTISRFKFVLGAEICGGPIDIATISRKEGFNWIAKK